MTVFYNLVASWWNDFWSKITVLEPLLLQITVNTNVLRIFLQQIHLPTATRSAQKRAQCHHHCQDLPQRSTKLKSTVAHGASKNCVQSGRVESMHLIQRTTSKVFSARGGVHRTIPWVQWYRYQQSTLWCTMSWTIGHGGPAKYAEAEIRAVESWVFIDCFFLAGKVWNILRLVSSHMVFF